MYYFGCESGLKKALIGSSLSVLWNLEDKRELKRLKTSQRVQLGSCWVRRWFPYWLTSRRLHWHTRSQRQRLVYKSYELIQADYWLYRVQICSLPFWHSLNCCIVSRSSSNVWIVQCKVSLFWVCRARFFPPNTSDLKRYAAVLLYGASELSSVLQPSKVPSPALEGQELQTWNEAVVSL